MSDDCCPAFPGARMTPDDSRYPTLVRGFNQRWVGRPRYVQVVGSAQRVVETVQHCLDHNLRPTVRSGGHWPDETFDGCYVNYCGSDLKDWRYLYYKENYSRFQRVKGEWDPLNVFHHGQSIELPR